MNTTDKEYAPSSERDRFLAALDGDDQELSTRLAVHMTGCGNPLPSSTCRELGLPVGSSYGSAARQVIRNSDGPSPLETPQASVPESQAANDRIADGSVTA